ncbi:MAG: DEAD/DEAH box helicase [Deltaproteobacteria bacterium]|nr:DEAD/DEAH box helicase [Deltaproteobacteria bacterium]
MSFANLDLISPLLKAVDDAGYSNPTPIQAQAIPPALKGQDVLGCAQTGTGKTAAFVLPILQRIDAVAGDAPKMRALVLTPTRELAAQIGDSLATYGKHLDLYHSVIFGGVSEKAQIEELRKGVDILVATPGRLLDLMQRKFVRLSDLEVFVLDEADRMLDMGFLPDVRRIIAALPKKRQTLFFSATMPPEIGRLAAGLLTDPAQVTVTPVSSTVETVGQKVLFTDKPNKTRLLIHLLNDPLFKRTIVFSRTKHGANRVVGFLEKAGIKAAAIHGNKSQGARTRALEGFRAGSISVLVATDIAARGIDVDGVSHVVNFDIPNEPETYVHRIGRTGRAGASGQAVSLCDGEERAFLRDIERLIKLKIPVHEAHPYPPNTPAPADGDLDRDREPRPPRGPGGGRGGRPGGSRHSHDRPRSHGPRTSSGGRSGASGRPGGGPRP